MAQAQVADQAVRKLGERMRILRAERRLTLRALAQLTGLSPQMLSQVERGTTNPSIGTLIVIAAAFEVNIADLFGESHDRLDSPLLRRSEQEITQLESGVSRRVLVRDLRRHIEIGESTYSPQTASARQRRHHSGYEYATILEGKVRVEIGDAAYNLEGGDSIRFASTIKHRYVNISSRVGRVMVVNLLV